MELFYPCRYSVFYGIAYFAMSVAKLLLDSLLATIGPWHPNERGALVLTVAPDVIVNFVEDETAEEVHIFSAAGYLLGDDAVAVELDSDSAGQGHFSVHVAQRSGLVVTLRTLQRAQLDEPTFCRELAGHVTAARALASVLSESRPDDDQDDEPARWLPCPMDATQPETLTLTMPGRFNA